jgi:hypothetical protein
VNAVHTVTLPRAKPGSSCTKVATAPACTKATATTACAELPCRPFAGVACKADEACPATRTAGHDSDRDGVPPGCEKTCDDALARTSFEESASLACRESAGGRDACCAGQASDACTATRAAEASKCCAEAGGTEEHQAELRIPEIGRGAIAGEWIIPRDEILLVAFGPHTVADKDGKAVVRERVAVISAEEFAHPRTESDQEQIPPPLTVPKLARSAAAATAPASPAPGLPMPTMPSRTLPQGVNTDGTTAELPPLPDETAEESPADASSEPRPSPQAKRPRPEAEAEAETPSPPTAKPSATRDGKAAKTSFSLPRGLFRPAGLPAIGIPNLQFTMPLKPFELKLPLNQKLQLELIGRVVPDTEPATESEGDKG